MPSLSAAWAHLIIGLAGIGALSALAVTGTITGPDALAGIGVFGGVGLGATAVSVGASTAAAASATGVTKVPGA